jgi:hypothetical protein
VESHSENLRGNDRVLFFSRGRGHGHAIPDMAIGDELLRLLPLIDLKFVSYGTGAATFRANGRPVIDLEMPDANPPWETVFRAGQVIRDRQPCLVVSHEEFAVLPVAKIFGIPTVFITEWFSDSQSPMMQALAFADEVICIEAPGVFDEPPCVEGKVFYTGPVLRRFEYSRADRDRARKELGLAADSTIILVTPGGWATEEREPFSEILIPAFDRLKAPGKMLVWIAANDYALLSGRFALRKDVLVKEHDWQMDRLMVASDLAITKANRITLKELAALGIPSISISQGRNPIDDMLIERIPTNVVLDSRTANPRTLLEAMAEGLERGEELRCDPPASPPECPGARRAAERLAELIGNLATEKHRATACLWHGNTSLSSSARSVAPVPLGGTGIRRCWLRRIFPPANLAM